MSGREEGSFRITTSDSVGAPFASPYAPLGTLLPMPLLASHLPFGSDLGQSTLSLAWRQPVGAPLRSGDCIRKAFAAKPKQKRSVARA